MGTIAEDPLEETRATDLVLRKKDWDVTEDCVGN